MALFSSTGVQLLITMWFRDSFTTIKQLYEADIVYDVAGWDDYINAISNGKMVSLIGAPFWIPIINAKYK